MKLTSVLSSIIATFAIAFNANAAENPPNIIWIYIEDQNPWYSTYAQGLVKTPNIDALAKEGVVFERAYAPVPVCAPSRSALITGTYPIRTGTHDMRSGRVPYYQIALPEGVTTVPELFRKAGYATFNRGKDDYNFTYDRNELYTIGEIVRDNGWKGLVGSGHWSEVPEGMPFFAQLQTQGGKHGTGGKLAERLTKLGLPTVSPDAVSVPPQYPDIPEMRDAVADHLDSMTMTDYEVGEFMKQLKKDGLWDNSIIFMFSDHGSALPRSKEFCYDEGLRVPLVVVAPGMQDIVVPGTRRSDLATIMDVTATSLALAGLDIPTFMDSKNLFAKDYKRDYLFASADRMSNVIDRVRSVTGPRFHYIRNFLSDRSLNQWGHRDMVGLPEFVKIRQLYEQGKLTEAQALPYGPRSPEELYDLDNDPHELINLAKNPKFKAELDEMRKQLATWIEDTDDKGQYPRSAEAMREITERFPPEWLKGPDFQ